MHLNWILIAMPLALLLYFAWVVTYQKPTAHVVSRALSSLSPDTQRRLFPHSKRKIRWMSPKELEAIIYKFHDVIFIDLLPASNERPRPFPGVNLLYVDPDEMYYVLRWSPPGSCVLLYGPLNLCKAMVRTAREITGRAPVFVLVAERLH
jgi:hypothetical protein